jgi:SAM-dependent methyltransferase
MEAEQFRSEQRAAWDAVARAWQEWWAVFERGAQSLNELLVELAGIAPGYRVLDVATGIGEPALTAARRVGPTGRVVATDLSPGMLAVARERVQRAGLVGVELLVADAEDLAEVGAGFDAAICRWGLMLMRDPVAAARSVRAVLRPGARFAAAVWGRREQVPFLALAGDVVLRELGGELPDPDAPGAFRLCDPDRLCAVLAAAGFVDPRIVESVVPMAFASPDDYARFVGDVSGSTRQRLLAEPAPVRERVLRAIAAAARTHAGGDGEVALPSRVLCIVGTA